MIECGELETRRRELRLSRRVLAIRAGLSEATVKRMLGGELEHASLANVTPLFKALGYEFAMRPAKTVSQMREEAAHDKAVRLAARVQATSGLEAQALGDEGIAMLV